MKKKNLAAALGLTLCFELTVCASWDRAVTDNRINVSDGMRRPIPL